MTGLDFFDDTALSTLPPGMLAHVLVYAEALSSVREKKGAAAANAH